MAGGPPMRRASSSGKSSSQADTKKVGSKNAWLPFLVCGAPALTALWMSGILWLMLKSW
eukprot:CAMPEP_0173103432 /NCGR_PEP_ID=MMETSP1102-20130122/38370_1 /TAXON_ID=49646 /ORGANISM="Geminigera sp., Strain Caron Lab Isolate" /LENGTH=58 /DNA_ID=CAMNT_0013998213 /DNA_START=36 /DNA_END=209 /DNA_ORIENTATION=+